MPKKLTYEFITNTFAKIGYTLLESTYKNAQSKMKYVCNKGHSHYIRWADFQQGVRCSYCYGNARLTTEFISKELSSVGYKLLSEYKNCYSKLMCLCDKGHTHDTTWNDWRAGCRCRTCAIILKSVNQSGPLHPQWRGGISFKSYCSAWFDKEYRESILKRDSYKCQNPYCFKRKGNSAKLSIHHIDYDRGHCNPSNLITLCKSCNSMANKDRKWHKEWYKAILDSKYKNRALGESDVS